jgi:molecular chaperone GrpE (heat shock protein)
MPVLEFTYDDVVDALEDLYTEIEDAEYRAKYHDDYPMTKEQFVSFLEKLKGTIH